MWQHWSSEVAVEKNGKPLDKRKKTTFNFLFLLAFAFSKTLPYIFCAFESKKSVDNLKKKLLCPGFPALAILLTIKLYSVSSHMHPNKGFKVWIETETVSAFGQQMQRKLAMFPLFARKAWKLGPLLCQRERKALIFLHTDFCKYWSLTYYWYDLSVYFLLDVTQSPWEKTSYLQWTRIY